MKIRIKNMVCRHCVAKVAEIASAIPGMELTGVELGAATLSGEPSPRAMADFEKAILDEGFEIIRSRDDAIVDEIKHILISRARTPRDGATDIEKILTSTIPLSYRSLQRTFATVEGRTIENYFASLRIERVKELLLEDRLTLGEIAFETGFSSVPHLSSRFKQATGMTPTQFRAIGFRTPLPDV